MRIETLSDWTVRIYNSKDDIISFWKIENRLEHEAENEAVADINRDSEFENLAAQAIDRARLENHKK